MTDKRQVELFLIDFQTHWSPACYVVPRDTNKVALADLGITPKQREEEILNLTSLNYVSGPEPDRDRPNQVLWVFGTTIDSIEIYIKLSFLRMDRGCIANCLSFHRAKDPMHYPFC